MATLVLSTAGSILGGPVGGAFGSLIGQSIDRQLFGPGPRQGPRLGDLSVQTSSYGSEIPKLFGSMRVAGTIVWSTDLKEQSETEVAKGQPESITYSYSVSFAVALSSRPVTGIGRIWADGKLIRTADGEFTVPTVFRVHDGSEGQAPDPLIASLEGVDSTPAYRGLALAVFENLQLAEFGNRIPFLTFEVIADTGPVPVADVLSESSGGIIVSSATEYVAGYAAYGSTVTTAIEPIVDLLAIPLFDDGTILSTPLTDIVTVDDGETGCNPDEDPAPRIERSQVSAQDVPSALAMTYYDAARDYQAGLARASIDAAAAISGQLQLPAVLASAVAKALAETSLARRWAERDRLTLRLPPAFLGLRPGGLVKPAEDEDPWRIHRIAVESLATTVELRPIFGTVDSVPADPGRMLPSDAAVPGPTTIALIELPDDGTGAAGSPLVAVAAASWNGRAVPLLVEAGGVEFSMRTAGFPAVLGSTVTMLPPGQSAMFDLRNSVEVQLANEDDWLESRDEDALAAGANVAIAGDEIFQFGNAISFGGGRFRLSRLLRGRRGTEWAMNQHQAGERFVLLDPARLQRIQLSSGRAGSTVRVTPGGMADAGSHAVEHVVRGDAMRPPSPVHLRASIDSEGKLHCTWVRRSRSGWDWLDEVDAPLGSSVETYRVSLRSAAGQADIETGEPQAQFTAAEVEAVGETDVELSVVQVGDFAASYPAVIPITFNQE